MTLPDEVILERIADRNGGRLELSTIAQPAKACLEAAMGKWELEFRSMYEDNTGPPLARSINKSIRFFCTKDWSFNAFATGDAQLNVIGLHGGFPLVAFDVFQAALADPSIRPDVGDVGRESVSDSQRRSYVSQVRDLMDGRHDDHSYPLFELKARDIERRKFASVATTLAIDFIVMHEFSHIVRGHVDYARLLGGPMTIHERWQSTSPPFSSVTTTQALEMDADLFATRFRIRSVNHEWLRKNQIADLYEYVRRYLFSVGSILSMFEPTRVDVDAYDGASHPHPEVRVHIALRAARAFAIEMFQLDTKRANLAYKLACTDINQFRAWLGTGLPPVSPTPGEKIETRISQLRAMNIELDTERLKAVEYTRQDRGFFGIAKGSKGSSRLRCRTGSRQEERRARSRRHARRLTRPWFGLSLRSSRTWPPFGLSEEMSPCKLQLGSSPHKSGGHDTWAALNLVPMRTIIGSVTFLAILAQGSAADDSSLSWWQRRYADPPSLACAIYAERLVVEKNQTRVAELIPLLINKRIIFKDKDGAVVTVRDAAADVFFETGEPDYWLNENSKVKLIACCPLADGDCARVHIPALTESQFRRLRGKLSTTR